MKSGDAVFLHLAATMADPAYDLTLIFYECEEIASQFGEDVAELAEDLQRLSRWVGSFGHGALITLDYGAVADHLQPDESPRDMADAMAFARDGDLESTALALRRLVRRWLPIAQLEHAS